MRSCPACSQVIPDNSALCPSCQEHLGASSNVTRRLPPEYSATIKSLDGSRFLPGQVLASRYRIVDLLGRGGMGEVYRAEDLTLKQAVALKFLPETLIHDEPALERIRQEVRVARQIAHPHVCRVYDIGEADGQHFLCMEFIKGEELASVIKRFGRLPGDKALEIARQICAGLAAAHKQGVIHRDLKPANVMIDDEGNAKITDFGLAAVAEQLRADDRRSGTPAYMSPEQLAGRELTTRSDIYSLGLVLYEIFTGKRAFEAANVHELLKLRNSDQSVTSPSRHVTDVDPVVERVIMRCLEKAPDNRPESPLGVAAALPGGDPIAAALAMGETPSPEMVAAAPKVGILRPITAVLCVAGIIVGLGLFVWLSKEAYVYQRAPLNNSPEVLRAKAREHIRSFGYPDGIDAADDLTSNRGYIRDIEQNDQSTNRWDRLRFSEPPVFIYWYRQSPQYMFGQLTAMVRRSDPPMDVSGMTRIGLDLDGKMFEFLGVPPPLDTDENHINFDWDVLFHAAGLDRTRFSESLPIRVPEVNSDERAAWVGFMPETPEIPIRIEAAAYKGRPVFFATVYPWDKPHEVTARTAGETAVVYISFGIIISLILGGVFLARRNYLARLGDHKGGARIGAFIFVVLMTGWLLRTHHAPDLNGEFESLLLAISASLMQAAIFYSLYLALEPFVRRRWPVRIIAWNRMLASDFRDPLVGRDILIGMVLGTFVAVVNVLWILAPGWIGSAHEPLNVHISSLLSLRRSLDGSLLSIVAGLGQSFAILFFLTLLVAITRRDRIATFIGWGLLTALMMLGGGNVLIDFFFGAATALVMIFCMTRIGLLATVALFLTAQWMFDTPFSTDPSVWYSTYAVPGLVVIAFLLIYSYRTATAGESLFAKERFGL